MDSRSGADRPAVPLGDLVAAIDEVWSEWRNGRTPTPADRVAATIHDAYLPIDSEP